MLNRIFGCFVLTALMGIAAVFGLNGLLLQMDSPAVPGQIVKKVETIDISRTGTVTHKFKLWFQDDTRLEVSGTYYDSVREGQPVVLRRSNTKIFGPYTPKSLYTRVEGQTAVEPLLLAASRLLSTSMPGEPSLRLQAKVESARMIDIWITGGDEPVGTIKDFYAVVLLYQPPGSAEPLRAVDRVDLGSIAPPQAGQSIEIEYQTIEPRRAKIIGGTRNFWWINWSPYAAAGLAILGFYRHRRRHKKHA